MHEALTYSAFLRLPEAVSRQVKEEFVEEIMNVVELTPLRNAIVGLPGELPPKAGECAERLCTRL